MYFSKDNAVTKINLIQGYSPPMNPLVLYGRGHKNKEKSYFAKLCPNHSLRKITVQS